MPLVEQFEWRKNEEIFTNKSTTKNIIEPGIRKRNFQK